jgi:WD40 repeat protein
MHDADVEFLAFGIDEHQLITRGGNVVRLWNIDNMASAPVVLDASEEGYRPLSLSSDSRWLALWNSQGVVQRWDLTDLTSGPGVMTDREASEGTAMAISFDGRWLATSSYDEPARLWDQSSATDDPVTLPEHDYWLEAMAFSPAGPWLMTLDIEGRVRLVDIRTPMADPITLPAYANRFPAPLFSQDGRWLATVNFDNNFVELWRVTDQGIDSEAVVLPEQDGGVQAMAFDPTTRWLATGSDDGTARIWKLRNPTISPVVLRGSGNEVLMADFSPDSRRLATGTSDHTVRLWRVELGDLYSLACRTAGRNLSNQEWAQYLGGKPYRETCPNLPAPDRDY